MDTLVPERCVIFCWHACYEDVPSFLDLLKLKVQPYIVLMDNSYYNFYHYIMKCKVWKTHRKIPSQYRQYCLCTQCRQLSTDISVRQDQLCWFIFRHADNSLYDGYVVNRLVSVARNHRHGRHLVLRLLLLSKKSTYNFNLPIRNIFCWTNNVDIVHRYWHSKPLWHKRFTCHGWMSPNRNIMSTFKFF